MLLYTACDWVKDLEIRLYRRAQYNHKGLIKRGGQEGPSQRRHCDDRGREKEGYVTREGDVGVIKDYEPCNMAMLGSWKGKKPDSPRELPDVALLTTPFKPMKTISHFLSPEL